MRLGGDDSLASWPHSTWDSQAAQVVLKDEDLKVILYKASSSMLFAFTFRNQSCLTDDYFYYLQM